MPRLQKETAFQGKLYDQKDRVGGIELVLDTALWQEIMASSGVQAATTVSQLVAAIQAELTSIKTEYPYVGN